MLPLLDLYLSGEFAKEALTDRKVRFEKTILALERERVELATHLEAQVLSTEQIETVQEFAARVGEGLTAIEDDFDAKRRIVEEMDAWATVVVEDEKKVVYARCIFGNDDLSIVNGRTRRVCHPARQALIQLRWSFASDSLVPQHGMLDAGCSGALAYGLPKGIDGIGYAVRTP